MSSRRIEKSGNSQAIKYCYDGNSCQSYEYSVYRQVAAEDPDHPNPYMFTGRRFDIETGLYYYRAGYYNPDIGRFMQTDPVGYEAGMNLYLYCKNNPLVFVDSTGKLTISFPSCIVKIDYEAISRGLNELLAKKSSEPNYFDVNFYDFGSSLGTISVGNPAACAICVGCFGIAGISCGIVCAEEPFWDTPGEGFGSCMGKCLKSIPRAAPWYFVPCSAACIICKPSIH